MKHNSALPGMSLSSIDQNAVPVLKTVGWTIALWFTAAFTGGLMDAFNQPDVPPAPLGFFLLVPTGGFIIAYAVSPRLRQALGQIPLWLITIAHVWRLVGLGFVMGTIMHILPPQFGYPEGLGDFIAAVLCVPLALALRRNRHSPRLRAAFVAWNVFGLIDLVSAITMGILYSNGPLGVLRSDISTAPMVTFPVHLIPTFFVPLFILLHLLSLKRSRELTNA
ncbi:hypothetical protein FGKAn22_02580 [Ferrigenium kumadai]|uniref:Uncharacterized protein n=1 Tax=Ferrigenium kumadai TaxID=1682490 RepID=A0AAN1SYR6_9PROT|nr:hypothetical protein [Ferrigenium kumadai]BBI98565.1 hypothetical protein FGKAn22_02580 [Ferrigenium kumadai]